MSKPATKAAATTPTAKAYGEMSAAVGRAVTNPLAADPLTCGSDVSILANKKPGKIRGVYDHIGSDRTYLVRYVNDTGTVCEDWLHGHELSVPTPKPAKKPAAKA